MAYWQSKGLPRGGKIKQPNPYKWCKTSIAKILSQQEYCADCKSKLWFHINTKNKDIHYFSCSNYDKDYRGTCQTRHYVRADAIEEVVTYELQRLADFLRYDQDGFAQLLADKTNKDMLTEQKQTKSTIEQSQARIKKLTCFMNDFMRTMCRVKSQIHSLWNCRTSTKMKNPNSKRKS